MGDPSRQKDRRKAREELSAKPHLDKLYKKYIGMSDDPTKNKIRPKQGTRNTTTVAMVTFLFRAVSVVVLKDLCTMFYRINQTIFVDSLAEHKKDINSILGGVRKTWAGGLNKVELEVYDGLFTEDDKTAFRICRDLGHSKENFYMGQLELARRLLPKPYKEKGESILHLFEQLELIRRVKSGKPWAKGRKAMATIWRWNHSMFGTMVNGG